MLHSRVMKRNQEAVLTHPSLFHLTGTPCAPEARNRLIDATGRRLPVGMMHTSFRFAIAEPTLQAAPQQTHSGSLEYSLSRRIHVVARKSVGRSVSDARSVECRRCPRTPCQEVSPRPPYRMIRASASVAIREFLFVRSAPNIWIAPRQTPEFI